MELQAKVGVQGQVFTSPAFGDGSGLHGPSPRTIRCGISVASVNPLGHPITVAYGVYPSHV
eukprot:2315549-Pyramimonas_sp.AAC.1